MEFITKEGNAYNISLKNKIMMTTFTSIKGCVFVPCILLCLSQYFHIGCTLKKIMQDESIGFAPPTLRL
jgi:hypothetical protein